MIKSSGLAKFLFSKDDRNYNCGKKNSTSFNNLPFTNKLTYETSGLSSSSFNSSPNLGKKFEITALNLNIRSLCNKKHLFELELSRCKDHADIILITESWLKMDTIMPLEGYQCADSFIRSIKNGGGTIIYCTNGTSYDQCNMIVSLSLESIIEISAIAVDRIQDSKLEKPIYLISIYRPPEHGEAFDTFIDRMEALFTLLLNKNLLFFVSGDFNVDLLNKSCSKTVAFSNLLESFSIEPVFRNTPSRVSKSSSTLIDNCFSNIPVKSSTTYDFGLSDHYGQIVTLDCNHLARGEKKTPTFLYRQWSEENKFNLGTLLFHMFSILLNCYGTLSSTFENFNKQIYMAMENCCPLKPGKRNVRNKASYNKKKINQLLDEKKDFYLLYIQTGNKTFRKASRKAEKKLRKELYRQKRACNDDLIKNSKNRGKTIWNIINSETKAISQSWIKSIFINNNEIFNPHDISNEFNEYFANLAVKNTATINSSEALNILNSCYPSVPSHFKFCQIDSEDLYAVICQLKPNKSDRNGNIPTSIFKDYFHILGQPLLSLLNSCLEEGTFPDFMKIGTITPLLKKGNGKLLANYRPITVLPTVAKIFERIIYLQLNHYFETNNLISKNQFGFRKNMSTVHAVQKLLDNIFKAFESKVPALSLHLDLSKAFDSIDHDLLLKKLEFYGLNEHALKLMSSYLLNRKQIVKINTPDGEIFSRVLTVETGVPQGSILGPLLFNIFINDLPKYLDVPAYLFADDTSVFLAGNELLNEAKIIFDQVSGWFRVNGLKVNEEKSQMLYYTPSVLIEPPVKSIKLSETVNLELSVTTRFLGLHIDQHLIWATHIDHVVSKIQTHKWALRNLVKVTSKDVALIFYHANIMSHLRYGLILWGKSPHANKLFIEQKKVLRILFNLPFNFSCKTVFQKNKLLTLPSLFILETLKFATSNGIITRSDLFPSHNHFTRHSSIKPEKHKYSVSKSNIRNASIQIFNALPPNLKDILKKNELTQFFSELNNFVLNEAFYHVDELISPISVTPFASVI